MDPKAILEEAKQGNPQAISALISLALQPRGITAKVKLTGSCLHVMLEGVTLPNQSELVLHITKGIKVLDIATVKSLVVSGRIVGEASPVWTEQVGIKQDQISPSLQRSESDKSVKAPRIKQRPLVRTRHVATGVGAVLLPLLIWASIVNWQDKNYAEFRTYMNRGLDHTDRGNYDEAISAFTQALKLQPDYVIGYSLRGNAYANQGNYGLAIADYNKVLKLEPSESMGYKVRGDVYAEQGNYNQAISDYNQALKLEPNESVIYNQRGLVYTDQGNYDQAILDYNQALKLSSLKAFIVYTNRGDAYTRQGRYRQAILDYNQALKLNPNYALAHYSKACLLAKKKNTKEAIEHLRQAIRLDARLRKDIELDPSFDSIRAERQFQTLLP